MKRFVEKETDSSDTKWYHDDVTRIVAACAAGGYLIDSALAARIWREYSEEYWAAGWIKLPDDDEEIFYVFEKRCDIEEDIDQ